jgi:hypothetical protein
MSDVESILKTILLYVLSLMPLISGSASVTSNVYPTGKTTNEEKSYLYTKL